MSEPASAVLPAVAPDAAGDRWQWVMALRCQLTVEISVPGFRLNDLLTLRPKAVLDTHWRVGIDVPVQVNGQLIGWGEFDTIHGRLAVRVTEVASR